MRKIITFHEVNGSKWFDGVICYLKSKYELMSVESLHECYLGGNAAKAACHITVDDGHKSFYDIIFPVLKKHNVPASIFVSPKVCKERVNYWFQEIGGYDQGELKRIIADMVSIPLNSLLKYDIYSILKTMPIYKINEVIQRYQKKTHTGKKLFQNMTVGNLQDVNRSGLVAIGAHTMNHPILRNEDDANSKYEIDESVWGLSTLLNREIRYFAYPNGIPLLDFTEREEGYLRNTGVELAFAAEARNMLSDENVMRVSRLGVSDGESVDRVRTKVFLGSSWNMFRRLKPGGEYRERKELNRIMPTGLPHEGG